MICFLKKYKRINILFHCQMNNGIKKKTPFSILIFFFKRKKKEEEEERKSLKAP